MSLSMPLSVFIVDDEPYIVDLLQALIDWDGLNMRVAGTSSDGEEAYRQIALARPDIVVTDIRLPGIDGLALIKKLIDGGSAPKFVIISGYKQFEYAQKAMNYGVREYILKPIRQQEINSALQNAARAILEDAEAQNQEIAQKKALQQNRDMLRESFCRLVLSGEALDDACEAYDKKYMLSFQEGRFQALLFHVDLETSGEEEGDESYVRALCDEFCYNFTGQIREMTYELLFLTEERQVCILMNYAARDAAALTAAVTRCVEFLSNKYVSKFSGVRISLALGSVRGAVGELGASCRDARHALRQRIFSGAGSIFAPPSAARAKSFALTAAELRDIRNAVEGRNPLAVQETLQLILSRGERGANVEDYWDAVRAALAAALRAMTASGQYDANIDWNQAEADLMARLENCGTISAFRKCFLSGVRQILDQYDGDARDSQTYIIRTIEKYVAENYMKRIRLQDLAEQVYLNPIYLSTYFKRVMGVNFVDYINEYRVERSKERLKDSNEAVYAVAQACGFPSAKYFTKMFRKYTGVSPSEYRNRDAGPRGAWPRP